MREQWWNVHCWIDTRVCVLLMNYYRDQQCPHTVSAALFQQFIFPTGIYLFLFVCLFENDKPWSKPASSKVNYIRQNSVMCLSYPKLCLHICSLLHPSAREKPSKPLWWGEEDAWMRKSLFTITFIHAWPLQSKVNLHIFTSFKRPSCSMNIYSEFPT